MASLREKWTVAWDDGEPLEIVTTVQDLINAADRIAPESVNNRVALQTSIIYAALQRLEHNPPPYDEWLNLLDRYDLVKGVDSAAGPTQPDPSATEPSSSESSPEPTGDPGSETTIEPLLLRNES